MASRGQKWLPLRKHKKYRFWKEFFSIFYQEVIFGLWRPENGKWNDFWVPRIMFFFAFFGLPEAENDLLALYTKKFFSKSGFLCVRKGGGSILASGGQKMQIKTYFGDPENNFFCHFLASKGRKRPLGMKYIERYFIYLCFMRWGNFFGLCC